MTRALAFAHVLGDFLDVVRDFGNQDDVRIPGDPRAVRIMKASGKGGSIIATASNAGLVSEPIVGMPYMPAKAGVLHMVRHLALELAEFRIRVNAIAPGPFVTNIGGGWVKNDPVARAAWDAIVPLGKMAETDQIKPLALLLASDASDYMTGSHVVIDGGMMLGKFG